MDGEDTARLPEPVVGGPLGRAEPVGGGPLGREDPVVGGPLGREEPVVGGPLGREDHAGPGCCASITGPVCPAGPHNRRTGALASGTRGGAGGRSLGRLIVSLLRAAPLTKPGTDSAGSV